jgi:hypothetical protein
LNQMFYRFVFTYFLQLMPESRGDFERLHSSPAGRIARPSHVFHWAHFASSGEHSYVTETTGIFSRNKIVRQQGEGTWLAGRKGYDYQFLSNYQEVKKINSLLGAFCVLTIYKAGSGGRILLSI